MEPSMSIRNYTKEELLEAFCRDVDAFALELATGDNTSVEETIEEVAVIKSLLWKTRKQNLIWTPWIWNFSSYLSQKNDILDSCSSLPWKCVFVDIRAILHDHDDEGDQHVDKSTWDGCLDLPHPPHPGLSHRLPMLLLSPGSISSFSHWSAWWRPWSWSCFYQDFKDKIKNVFAPTNYAEGLDNKAVVGMSKDAEAGGKVGKHSQVPQPTFWRKGG